MKVHKCTRLNNFEIFNELKNFIVSGSFVDIRFGCGCYCPTYWTNYTILGLLQSNFVLKNELYKFLRRRTIRAQTKCEEAKKLAVEWVVSNTLVK